MVIEEGTIAHQGITHQVNTGYATRPGATLDFSAFFRSRLTLWSILVVSVAGTPARASLINAMDASAMIQSTSTDLDFGFLTEFFGFHGGEIVNYNSTSIVSATWAGTLAGTYLGTGLSVAYTGDVSAYPSGPITWTDAGTYGAQGWSGSGSATITDVSATIFQVAVVDTLTIGSHVASVSGVIPGTVLSDGTIMFGDPANPEAGPVPAIIDGLARDIYLSFRMGEPGMPPISLCLKSLPLRNVSA
jgi:hypothetical protein